MKRLLHIFGHFWGPWETVRQGDIVNDDQTPTTGHYVLQERTCAVCNLVKLRREYYL